jgi:hypothetical protein
MKQNKSYYEIIPFERSGRMATEAKIKTLR